MAEAESTGLKVVDKFKQLPVGGKMHLPLSQLVPSQPDDKRMSRSSGPISAYLDDTQIVILHGNHRYYDYKRMTRPGRSFQVPVTKAERPL